MMVAFDSSTLILLAKTEILRIVTSEMEALIPVQVKTECLIKESGDAALIAQLIKDAAVRVERVGSGKAVEKLMVDFMVARGEAEALWLARTKRCVLAVDDVVTIKACRVLGQEFTTAIHFLIHLKVSGQLSTETALAKLEKLVLYGRYNQRIVEDASRRIG